MNKIVIFTAIFIVITIVIASLLVTQKTSPENKVTQLQNEKVDKLENSGYNDCIQKVHDADKAREEGLKDCITKMMANDGYTDNLKCVGTGEQDPVCEETARYNSEVNATNECNPQFMIKDSELTEYDCQELLSK